MTRAGGNSISIDKKFAAFSDKFSNNPRQLLDFIFPPRCDEKQEHRLQRISRALRVTPRKAKSIYYSEPRAKNEDAYLFIIIRAKIETWILQQHDEAERHQAASFARFHDLWGSLFDDTQVTIRRSDHAAGARPSVRRARIPAERAGEGVY